MPDKFLSMATILDISRATAGPFGSQILADLGALIIKVETQAGGANARESLEDERYQLAPGIDPMFLSVNRNKRSIVLDIGRSEGLEVFYQLVKKANVVYDNFRPGVMEALKMDYQTLRQINPRIISCSLTGYGANGPLARNEPASTSRCKRRVACSRISTRGIVRVFWPIPK